MFLSANFNQNKLSQQWIYKDNAVLVLGFSSILEAESFDHASSIQIAGNVSVID